jgi:hypothetical protein
LAAGSLATAQIPERAYFKFNTVTGTQVANESPVGTRVSANGTLTGLSLVTGGQFGSALGGGAGAASTGFNFHSGWSNNLSGAWTMSIWFSGINNTLANNYLFGDPGNSFRAFTGSGLVSGAGNILFRGTGMTDVKINGCFDAAGNPVVLTFVYDPALANIKAYVNGVLNTTVAQSASMAFTGGTGFTLGGYGSNNCLPSGGKIDEFRLYNRALTASEITNTWNIDLAPGCAAPANLAAANITNNSANISWNSIPSTQGYEYVLNQSATPPAPTASGTAHATNLLPLSGLLNGTTYYVHVRNRCSSTVTSAWSTIAFTTIGCTKPANLLISNVTDTGASVVWSIMSGATSYDYALDFSNQNPVTGIISTTSHFADFTDLIPNSKYYLHVRSRCFGTDSSAWRLDSFVTQMACYPPNVQVNLLGTNKPYAYWDPVPTAIGYEYVWDNYLQGPSFGASTTQTNASVTLPDDGKPYYLHVRSKCNSMFTFSGWSTTKLRDGVTSVAGLSANTNITTYPNPAAGVLHIDGAAPGTEYSVTDLIGRVQLKGKTGALQETINVASLPAAVYMLKLSTEQGQVHTFKFTKQ